MATSTAMQRKHIFLTGLRDEEANLRLLLQHPAEVQLSISKLQYY